MAKKYRIPLEGRWDLYDLYQFPHTYTQIYSVLYVLEEQLSKPRLLRRKNVFSSYPWGGGYSAVNWFNGLYFTVPPEDRPQVLEIRYHSPGWLDLGVCLAVALGLKKMLIAFSTAARHLNATYSQIQKGIHARKLNKVKLKRQEIALETERVKFVRKSCEEMARLMGFKNLGQIHELTGNPLVTLKMLCAIYRRLRILNEFQEAGKAKIIESIPVDEKDSPPESEK